ncbi:lactate/malate family dehydrogenase [Camelimonas lactis]|uniref:Malate dehydrogenase n=1 Tax=Camelimonas lactis TaxID=659006 RepID=A0A4R2GUZ7_9HYPH|nr:malate dehydrogenase [Camelimonas lactis]TCO14630.1 malate dehydrogenase [Camelimonas lactis]
MRTGVVAIVGVGHAGQLVAQLLHRSGVAGLRLIDTATGVAEKRAADMRRAAAVAGEALDVVASEDLADIRGADVVIVAAGLPPASLSSSDDWMAMNAAAMTQIGRVIGDVARDAFVVCLAGPAAIMTARLQEASGMAPQRIVGVPASSFAAELTLQFARELDVAVADVRVNVIGGEFDADDTAVLLRYSTVAGVPLLEIVPSGQSGRGWIEAVVARARKVAGEPGSGLKTGSASSAPAALAVIAAKSYLSDQKRVLTLAARLDGDYGERDVVVNAPVVIGRRGVERIIGLSLDDAERATFAGAVAAFRRRMALCADIAPASVQTGTAP